MSLISGVTAASSDSKAAQSQNKYEEDFNQFLNLLVTQLKNQDPLDPLDANEFTSQLVQFASVEQQINTNANLEKLVSLQQSSQTSFMVDYIGKTVETLGDQVMLENGQAEFNYILNTNAVEVDIAIQDASGVTVFNAKGDTTVGKHNVVWDGTDFLGNNVPDGAYKIVVSALDREGELLDVEQTVLGRVVGAGNDEGEPYLFVGEILTPMDQVLSVRETQTQTADVTDDTTDDTVDDTTGGSNEETNEEETTEQ